MGKKTKSKARLDKYYYLAKEHGFRSRAAFKLIQLNKKFHFLESATVLLDLCAAPGGWCQVASKQMPISSIRIGIDLDPIKPIPGVKTFQADITTQRCRNLIQQEIKDIKADVVLNDGAPNVGGQWSKDSYSQTELVLFAIKLATEFLREGGWFVTKVFRSSDYNSLIYVMRQLFGKVEATKPLASRTQAAEVFVVCSEYKAPRHIDPKLLDPKFALKQLEEEDEMKSNTVKSIKALFEQKKQRGGYNSESMYIKRSFKEFIECQNPYQFVFETNQILTDDDDSKEYIKLVKTPIDYETYFKDLKLLGKKEVQEMIIWRNKIKMRAHKHQDKEKEEEHPKEVKEHNVEEEIDEELEKFQKQRKKRQEQEKKKHEKQEFKNKQQFIEEQEQVQDNDVEFDQEVFDYIQKNKIDIENLDENIEEEKKEEEKEGEYDEYDLEDLSEDDYIDMMNEDIEENKRLYEEEKGLNPRKKKKKEKKKEKEEIEFVEQEKEESDMDEDLKGSDSDEEEGDNSSDYDEESDGIELEEEKSYEDEEDKKIGDVSFNNPLRKEKKTKKEGEPEKKEEKNEEENLSSDTDEEEEQNKKKKQKKEKEEKLLNKKTKREEKKEEDKEGESSSSEDDGYDTDEKAEIRAIAKKMLRKKDRIDILNKTYNRYAFEEDERAPKWFIEEERQHNVPQKPVTKAEILAERSVLKKIVDRMPKKILEAKARKRNKLNKRLEKVKKKAEAISNQEEINEFSKVKQIEKLYKKELAKGKEKKKYIVSRAFTHNNRGKDGRNYKHVDRRLKKDKRAEKAREKRNKKFKRSKH